MASLPHYYETAPTISPEAKAPSITGADSISPSALLTDVVDSSVSRAARSRRSNGTADRGQYSVAKTSAHSAAVNKVISVPNLFSKRNFDGTFANALQEWEGAIESVDNEGFSAVLRDLTNATSARELAHIPFDEVDPKDRSKIVPGAIFHLIIAYARRGGTQKRETMIYFRKYVAKRQSPTARLADLLDMAVD